MSDYNPLDGRFLREDEPPEKPPALDEVRRGWARVRRQYDRDWMEKVRPGYVTGESAASNGAGR